MKIQIQKKYCLSFILFILLTFSFAIKVQAAATVAKQVAPGTTITLIKSSEYAWGDGKCTTSNGTTLDTLPGSSARLKYGTLMYNGGAIKMVVDDNAPVNTTETITCTYAYKISDYESTFNAYEINNGVIKDNDAIQAMDSVKYKITYYELEADDLEWNFSLDQQKNPTFDLGTRLRERGIEIANVSKIDLDDNAQKYLDVSCGSVACSVKIKPNVTIPDDMVNAVIKFSLTDKENVKHEIKSEVQISSTLVVFAYGGNYGKCYWGNGWERVSDVRPDLTRPSNDYENTRMFKYKDPNQSITFPNCDASNSANPDLKFKGFVANSSGLQAGGASVQASGTCANFIVSTPSPSATDYKYFACYEETNDAVKLYVDGTVNDSKFKYESNLNYYYRKLGDGETVQLPTNVELRVSSINPNAKFIGWTNNGDCDNPLNNVSVGPGVYTACMENSSESEEDYNKTMYEGDEQDVKVVPGMDTDVTGCFSESSNFVTTSFKNGVCTVKAVKTTKGGKVTVTFQDKDGNSKNYIITVKAMSEAEQVNVDDFILDSTNGATADKEIYGDSSEAQAHTCDEFEISVNGSTQAEKGYVVGQLNDKRTLRVHLYNGYSGDGCGLEDGGADTKYVGVCMDPGRQEPNGQVYYTEREMDPVVNEFDRVIGTIYRDKEFLKQMKSYSEGGKPSESKIKNVIAATVAIRLAAIQYGEDANNTGLGLDEYYAAYKEIVNNMNKKTGGKKKGKTAEYVGGDWKLLGDSNDYYCGDLKNCNIYSDYRKIVTKYLKDAANTTAETWKTREKEIIVKVTNRKPEWSEDGLSYKVTVTGTISGLPDYSNGDMRLTASCDKGLNNGNKDKKAKCVLYIRNAKGEWQKVNSATNYWSWKNSDDVLFFKMEISQTIANLLAVATKGDEKTTSATDFDANIKIKHTSPDLVKNVKITMPSHSTNRQRMILFPFGSELSKECKEGNMNCNGPGNGTPTDDGSDWGDNTGLSDDGNGNNGNGNNGNGNNGNNGNDGDKGFEGGDGTGKWNVSGNMSLEIKDESGEPIPLVFTTETHRIGNTLPACDTKQDIFNYNKYCTSKNNCTAPFSGELFRLAKCCSFVLDTTKYVYQNVCTDSCTVNTVNPVCDANSTEVVDTLEVKEAYNSSSGDNYTCIIDVGSKERTDTKTDLAGNKYSLGMFKNNPYCGVSCKEDWEFKFPAFKNHTGANAVLAGSYFTESNEHLAATGKRTCVTTAIDHNKFAEEYANYSKQSMDGFNNWQRKKAIGEAFEGSEIEKEEKEYCSAIDSTYHYAHCSDGVSNQANCPSGSWISGYYTYECKTVSKCKEEKMEPKKTSVKYKVVDGDEQEDHDKNEGVSTIATENTKAGDCTCSNGSCSCTGSTKGTCGKDTVNSLFSSKYGWGIDDKGDADEAAMHEANGNLSAAINNIEACDEFQLVTKNTKNVSNSRTKISTVFDPSITFTYDEEEFMDEVNASGTNKLVQKDKKDEVRTTEIFSSLTDVKAYTGPGEKVADHNIDRFKGSKRHTVCSSGGSGTAVVGANKESSGHLVSWSSDPGCSVIDVRALYSYPYIKRSIENSSNFGSEYQWWSNKSTDVKIYTKSLQTYPKKSVIGSSIHHWSLFGSSNQDKEQVFPIKLNTPRNMYKYSYTLTNIGMYNDKASKVGRLMGGTNPVVGNNVRTCFYEVLENICLCCADVIDTETVSPVTKLSTQEALKAAGSDYVLSKKNTTDVDSKGQLGFYNNTVSLASLDGGNSRTLGSNWVANTKYNLEGNIEVTNKGAILKNYIESKGEDVYDEAPEYSYTLNPAAMSAIRTYNENNGYQVRSSSLTTYGPLRIHSGENTWNANWKVDSKGGDNDYRKVVSFNHYGSRFLEVNMKNYKNGDIFTDREGLCFVYVDSEKKVKDVDLSKLTYYITNKNGQNNTTSIKKCRWVDYISQSKKSGGYSRLAFK